jgi:hypothetical protein
MTCHHVNGQAMISGNDLQVLPAVITNLPSAGLLY